ncbi:hypothetical protein E4U09_003164 [Claviceps aff. purpurea]|uniref:Cyanovirin-N domain-containing protein n=1 Tax=Claviceps aff. purpurea TaxID=1967640 RepID=A0A9P7QEY7_9HYPO|nr:hypothetical protein E4U09_003164 [Claviceps aff. purpurea]
MHAISLLAFLLPLVAARNHKQCDCWSFNDPDGWGYNTGLTHYVCNNYYSEKKTALYDDGLGRCLSRNEQIDGDEWQLLCQQAGQNGYHAITADGDIDLSSPKEYRKDVFGHCLK